MDAVHKIFVYTEKKHYMYKESLMNLLIPQHTNGLFRREDSRESEKQNQ